MPEHRVAIEVIWTLGLAGILIPTIVVLKQVSVIIQVLKEIETLAGHTLVAARGIGQNVQPLNSLGTLLGPAGAIRENTAAIAEVSASLVSRIPFKG